LLGGKDFVKPENAKSKHDSRTFSENNKTISEQGHHNLCRVLREEIGIYLQVLQKATNLKDADVEEAVESLQRLCGDSLTVRDLL